MAGETVIVRAAPVTGQRMVIRTAWSCGYCWLQQVHHPGREDAVGERGRAVD